MLPEIAKQIKDLQYEVERLKTFDVPRGNLGQWFTPNQTWVQVSANSFKIVGRDVTAYFPFGAKLSCINTTLKYFYCLGAVFSAGDTTVTVTGGIDYTLAAAAITSPRISYGSSADGFPHWFNYTATISGSAGSIGTFSTDLTYAKFHLAGRSCHMLVRARMTNLGSWTGDVRMLYPVQALSGVGAKLGNPAVYRSGGLIAAPIGTPAIEDGTVYFRFYKSIFAILQWADLLVNDHILINTLYQV